MPAEFETEDKTTVAPEVLVKIARLTALSVAGVSHLVAPPGGQVRGWLQRGVGEGVALRVVDSTIEIELYLAISGDHNVVEVSHVVQAGVARAMEEMVGLDVAYVNVHIEDVDY